MNIYSHEARGYFFMKNVKNNKKSIGYYLSVLLASMLGAVGTALQNYMAVLDLFKTLAAGTLTATKLGWGILHGGALALGGICSGVVNCCMNLELLGDFYERMTSPGPKLSGWRKFRYWFGGAIFIGTGILFGLTAFAFVGALGPLAIVSIAAGVFVAVIMMIQELETWLGSFKEDKSLWQIFKDWKKSLTIGKLFGSAIAIGNVVALSLLFTLGLATVLSGVGLPLLPAMIAGIAIAFTVGAFTEFYFYNTFLSDFCGDIKTNLSNFWQSKFSPVGLLAVGVNAVVNGVLSYVGIGMVIGLAATAIGVAMPPVGVVIAVAATLAVFAGLASFILGLAFWQRNMKKIFGENKPATAQNIPGSNAQQAVHQVAPAKALVKDGSLAVESAFGSHVASDSAVPKVPTHLQLLPPVPTKKPDIGEESVFGFTTQLPVQKAS